MDQLSILPLRLLLLASALALISCERTSDRIIDTVGTPPILIKTSLSPTVVNTDTINVGTERKPDDLLPIRLTIETKAIHADGLDQISRLQATFYKEKRLPAIATAMLSDNGISPDSVAGDSLYSAIILVELQRFEIGTFNVEVSATSRSGLESSAHVLPLTIVRLNQPPALTNLIAPDTVKLSNQTQVITLMVTATDADGLMDLLSVQFNSFRPGGIPSSGNPFQMFDDGNASLHGDLSAGDGVYSLKISLPPTTEIGSYRFEFQAKDRSNATSPILTHTIVVVP